MKKELNEFIEYLKLKNFSPATLETRYRSILSFIRWCKTINKTTVQEITLNDLNHFIDYMKLKEHTIFTIDTRVASIKKFFYFLEAKQYILLNPADNLEPMHLGKRLPKNILSEKEINQLLKNPNLSTQKGIRDRAIMELLYSTGLRRSECSKLKVFDVDNESGYVRVNQGKGRKDRVVPIGKKACYYLKNYLQNVRPKLNNDIDNHKLFMMHSESINRMLQRHAKESNVEKPVTIHSFRKSTVTHMLKGGASPVYIQRMLGHSTNKTMNKYIAVSIVDIKKMHDKKHPRDK